MRNPQIRLLALLPLLAVGSVAGAKSMGDQDRALTLEVAEQAGSVEIELIADSATSQKVDYKLKLTGSSTARHAGSTSVNAGERHVLSRLKTSFAESWCATVDVTEANGEQYTLTAGACAQG
ncbi:hypothetical protein NAP1_10438 [Erythrobacter sp. NAP1]|uniref:curli-like amyloid fiber formation chaperone CsgH n=1 Tax=Erythrobacter sp. NAP1 TaxID=237727 RepID=UPI00006877AC|nr:curli-like amyloid fiber formation chaperone CsgH [Erythrobacter sp. NAP1]EAQ28005.1 hypothetical protein NAP1_10438 [Erythrobacter sp. NAP1]